MTVRTQTPLLKDLRRGVMELYLSDHTQELTGEFKEMAHAVGASATRYGRTGENHLDETRDESNPYFTFDPAKCIVCSLCVRACDETQSTFALTIEGRGFAS